MAAVARSTGRGRPRDAGSAPSVVSVGLACLDFLAVVDHFPAPEEKMRTNALRQQGGGNVRPTTLVS